MAESESRSDTWRGFLCLVLWKLNMTCRQHCIIDTLTWVRRATLEKRMLGYTANWCQIWLGTPILSCMYTRRDVSEKPKSRRLARIACESVADTATSCTDWFFAKMRSFSFETTAKAGFTWWWRFFCNFLLGGSGGISLSISSSTICFTVENRSGLAVINSIKRFGVPMMTRGAAWRTCSAESCMLCPDTSATPKSPPACGGNTAFTVFRIWTASSRLGTITNVAQMCRLFCRRGSRNANVFPDPVSAWIMTSYPSNSLGIALTWTGLGLEIDIDVLKDLSIALVMPSRSNEEGSSVTPRECSPEVPGASSTKLLEQKRTPLTFALSNRLANKQAMAQNSKESNN